MLDKNVFASRLATARDLVHLSQRQLALRLGISPRAVGQYEQGENLPSVTTLVKIAEILHCSADFLLGLADDPHGASHPSAKEDV